ncbi:MAG: hypothetical protein ACRD8U_05305, partial [Pyrinomonadaceae bacterium]
RDLMSKIRKLCAATTLLFVLSLSAMAGDIHTDAVPPPPAPCSAIGPGDVGTGEIQSGVVPEDLVTEITLSLLQLLSVF